VFELIRKAISEKSRLENFNDPLIIKTMFVPTKLTFNSEQETIRITVAENQNYDSLTRTIRIDLKVSASPREILDS
jgi:hypothetical protein